MKFSQKTLVGIAVAFLGLAMVPTPSQALTLTAQGLADGFLLTTFAFVDPGNTSFGPFGIAVASNGNIIVNNTLDNRRYVWTDVDGQNTGTAVTSVFPSDPSFLSQHTAYATAGGKPYGGVGGSFAQFNDNGTVNHFLVGTQSTHLGMWGNPVDGHIIATSGSGLIDIDPLANGGTGSSRVIVPSPISMDGVSVSPDGKTAYVADFGSTPGVNGYDIATGNLVFSSGNVFGGVQDGIAVIIGGTLDGKIIVNRNNGEIDLLDPTTKTFHAIATQGTRGDYVSPDVNPLSPNNGSLFVDMSDNVFRLSCAPGACEGIGGGGGPVVPEPGTLALSLSGGALAALGKLRRRKGV